MYEIYCKLRDAKGVKDADVARDTDITKSTFSDWASGRSKPKQAKLQKIADYFGVSFDYLMTGKEYALSKEQAELDLKITNDLELRNAVEKYYTLDERKRKHVLELIDILSEV